jgi:hypothetical protein
MKVDVLAGVCIWGVVAGGGGGVTGGVVGRASVVVAADTVKSAKLFESLLTLMGEWESLLECSGDILRDDMEDTDQLDGDDKGVLYGVSGDMAREGDISRTVGTGLLSASDDGLVSMDSGDVIGSDAARFGQL